MAGAYVQNAKNQMPLCWLKIEFFRAEKHDEVQWKKEMVEMWTKPRLK